MLFLLYAANLDASVATRSKMSAQYVYISLESMHCNWSGRVARGLPLTKELRMLIARLEIPVSGWTCLRTTQ